MENHGHRGSRGTHPENSLPAFEEAAAAGADFVELDLQWSSDDEPMVFHDPFVSAKLCLDPQGAAVTVPVPLRRLTAAQIVCYDCGSIAQKDFPRQKLVPGTHIPRFSEVLRWQHGLPRIGVNVEIKMDSVEPQDMPDPDRVATQVLDLLGAEKLLDRAQIQSFDFRPLRTARRLLPSLRVACLFDERADFAAVAAEVGANVVGPSYRLLDAASVKACHARGIKVIPWTANDPKDWTALVALGVDGIITDYPRELGRWMDRRAMR